MEATHVWRLVQEWIDGEQFPPTQAAIARYLHVQRSAVSQWKTGKASPSPENLRSLAAMTGLPYSRFLDALLRDQGYLRTETFDDTASTTRAGESPAKKSDYATAARRARRQPTDDVGDGA